MNAILPLLAVFSLTAVNPSAPGDVPHTSSLMLTIEIDHAGVSVIQALRKPGLKTRLPRDWKTFPHRWRLLGSQGQVLTEGGFDPGDLCLDPRHANRPPHVSGDQIRPHVGHMDIKVPDLGTRAHTIEFLRRVHDGKGSFQRVSSARVQSLRIQ